MEEDKIEDTKELFISGYRVTFSIANDSSKLELEDLLKEYLYNKFIKV